MTNRRHHAFARQPVQRPHREEIELAPMRGVKHGRELWALVGAFATAGVVDELSDDLMVRGDTPVSKLTKLVLLVLAAVICADAGVNRHSHSGCSMRTR